MNEEIKITIRQICDKMNFHKNCIKEGCHNCPVEKLTKQLENAKTIEKSNS